MAQTMFLSRTSWEGGAEPLTVEDFETASIRSAAPSYRSEAPSTHYTVPLTGNNMLPPYTAPAAGSVERMVTAGVRHHSVPSRGPVERNGVTARRSASASAASGLGSGRPPAPTFADSLLSDASGTTAGSRRRNDLPSMSQFRIPSWSTISSNPNARLYHSVALRRVAAAEHATAAAEIGILMRRLAIIERMEQEEAAARRRRLTAAVRSAEASGPTASSSSGSGSSSSTTANRTNNATNGRGNNSNNNNNNNINNNINNNNNNNNNGNNDPRFRPLEDPYLVGETAARRARAERLAREAHTPDDTLVREDRRWDWFLGQIKGRGSGRNPVHGRLRRRADISVVAPSAFRYVRQRA